MTENMPPDPFRAGDINLPFLVSESPERLQAGSFDLENGILCGGLTLKATAIDVPGLGVRPGLVFQFHKATGEFLQPMIFITENESDFVATKELVFRAVNTAATAAKELRKGNSAGG